MTTIRGPTPQSASPRAPDAGPPIGRYRNGLCEAQRLIEGHAFTTGVVPRTSIEHVLPNTWVEYGVKNRLGCDVHAYMDLHFTAEELAGKA